MTTMDIKGWVVQKASVTMPRKDEWSASVTLGGMDINGIGETVEKAYNELVSFIKQSPYYSTKLQEIFDRQNKQ
jgi:hypothetical protein